jgi:hypothetical protein
MLASIWPIDHLYVLTVFILLSSVSDVMFVYGLFQFISERLGVLKEFFCNVVGGKCNG